MVVAGPTVLFGFVFLAFQLSLLFSYLHDRHNHRGQCVGQIDAETLKAVAQECGWEEGGGESTAPAAGGDHEEEENGEASAQPKGVKALGGGNWVRLLWENRDKVKAVIEKLIEMFVLKSPSQTAGQDGSTTSAAANKE